MPTFAFDSAPLSTLAANKTYYAQMVSSVPSQTNSVMGDLNSTVLSTPQVLTGVTYSNQLLNFADQTFNTRTYLNTHTGYVLAERVGTSFSSTDPLIVYVPHANGFGQEITLPIGTYGIPIDFPSGGLFGTVNGWQYQIGSYTDNGASQYNNGMIQLIGTKNNTTAYANPATISTPNIETLSSTNQSAGYNLFNRTSAFAIEPNTNASIMLRFRGNGDIKFNTGGQMRFYGYFDAGVNNVRVWGSNLLNQGWVSAAINDATNWTQLVDCGSQPNPPSLKSSPIFSTAEFYRYIKIGFAIGSPTSGYFGNIDFYNCTVRTANQNFV